jgi:3-carboxy-cis,cis-muconate cycloisomerase
MPDLNGGSSKAVTNTTDPAGASARPGFFDGVFARTSGAGGGAVADEAAWLRSMLAAEAGLARALERAGLAPAGAGAAVTKAADAGDFGPAEVAELGRAAMLTGNPVPGLARVLTRRVTDSGARSAVHQGATSQDIMDTAAMLLARDALGQAVAELTAAADATARLADANRGTLMIGRTLLQQAVPTTFGVIAAGWLAGLDSAIEWLAFVRDTRLAVRYGGAAGTLASLGGDGDRVKTLLAEELGLADPPLPWHTERLRIIDVATVSARACAALSKIARDVTLLAQGEVQEVREGGPGGRSSAMAHKRNPVASVSVIACTERVPGLVQTMLTAMPQEHERAAGRWQAEWGTLSDLLRLTGSAAAWSADLLENLEVDTDRMRANLVQDDAAVPEAAGELIDRALDAHRGMPA